MESYKVIIVVVLVIIIIFLFKKFKEDPDSDSDDDDEPAPMPKSKSTKCKCGRCPECVPESMTVRPFDYERACKYGQCNSQMADNNLINYGDDNQILNSI